MIIWGGFGITSEATGGRYNPITDSWGVMTSTVGAPSGRTNDTQWNVLLCSMTLGVPACFHDQSGEDF